jgi:RNA polymerase sigma-70 factor (ECF subfamily)
LASQTLRTFGLKFEEFYQQHVKFVYNLALHYTQCVEDAQEITQDVFVRVFQGLNNFQNNAHVSTWLYRITINQCLDLTKARKRQKRFALLTSLFFPDSNDLKHNPPDNNHPGIQMEHKESVENLLHQINQLPDNQRTALILHKIEQRSQAEVAVIMNLSLKAVESLVQRAKSNLEKKIG